MDSLVLLAYANLGTSRTLLDSLLACLNKVGKGGHTPFSKIPHFLEIQDAPTFHRSIGKTKVLNNSCNQFVYNFYPQSILILEECLQKW